MGEQVKKKSLQIDKCQAEIQQREELVTTITGHEEKIKSAEEVDLADPADNGLLNMSEFGPTIKASKVLPLRCTVNLMGIPVGEGDTKDRGPAFPMMCDIPGVERS